MKVDCVLVIENHTFQRGVLVKALQSLRIQQVLLADNARQAAMHLQGKGSIDIVFFDLNDNTLDVFEFWQTAVAFKRVRALILYSDLQPDIYRAVDHMTSLSGIHLLGVLEKPLQMGALRKMLAKFGRLQGLSVLRSERVQQLLSREDVLRGLAMGEFRAWFQPKFNLNNGALFGAEVLVRWDHPIHGLLLPRDLLTAVLTHGLINEMLEQLIEQGMALLVKLRGQGFSLQLAFNLASSQLARAELPAYLANVLRRYEFPGSVLMFEVAESGLLDLPVLALNNLYALRRLGCALSIDDFGAGFSSMRLLAHLPFCEIKLDGMFVQDLSSARNQVVVTSSLALAQALKMDLVIEGVSTWDIHENLLSLGCSLGQGFHLALPMDAKNFYEWLQVTQGELML